MNGLTFTSTPLLEWLVLFMTRTGRAPTPEEIREAANFLQPGGITRLCETLSIVAANHLKRAA